MTHQNNTAQVHKADKPAGTLTRAPNGHIGFTYHPEYLKNPNNPPISTTLPLTHQTTHGNKPGRAPTYFAGLLPEGKRYRNLCKRFPQQPDHLTILTLTGHDTIGDTTIHHPHHTPQTPPTPPNNYKQLLQNAANAPTNQLDTALPGWQNKLTNRWAPHPKQPNTPTILKPEPDNRPHLAANEHFFTQLAQHAGIHSAKTETLRDNTGHPALISYRFDRHPTPNGWKPTPQEDMCQLTDTYPHHSYDLTIRTITETLLQHTHNPTITITQLLTQYAYAYAIGNGDMHGKNISIHPPTYQLTPTYDMLSTLPYPQNQNMALKIDGRDNKIRARDLTDFARRYNIPTQHLQQNIHRITQTIEQYLPELHHIGYDPKTTQKLHNQITQRLHHLKQT